MCTSLHHSALNNNHLRHKQSHSRKLLKKRIERTDFRRLCDGNKRKMHATLILSSSQVRRCCLNCFMDAFRSFFSCVFCVSKGRLTVCEVFQPVVWSAEKRSIEIYYSWSLMVNKRNTLRNDDMKTYLLVHYLFLSLFLSVVVVVVDNILNHVGQVRTRKNTHGEGFFVYSSPELWEVTQKGLQCQLSQNVFLWKFKDPLTIDDSVWPGIRLQGMWKFRWSWW